MAPILNQDILSNICRTLLKDEEFDAECLNKFSLAGKESLVAFESVIASLKSVYIHDNIFLLKMTESDKTYLTCKPSRIVNARLLKVIGTCTKRIVFTGVSTSNLPIIDAICGAKRLKKLSYVDEISLTQGQTIPFWRIFEECHASLQKIVIPARYYFCQNPPIFHLHTLYFKSDEDDILSYLNHPSCIANELIIELREQEGNSPSRWEQLISCFRDFKNPALSSKVKKLKLKLHIEQYVDSALSLLLQAISTAFSTLQTFILINQLALDEYCHTFQDFMNHSTYYLPMYTNLAENDFNFSTEIEWNVKYNVVEQLFKPHYTDACRRIYSIFDSEVEDRNTLILFKNDELSPTKSISFEIKVINGEHNYDAI
uniref:Uncharacterized protein n=1 Tax=Panagrolaimus sp. PS1159 TaxID=55785 RepID=A0AC35GDJ6_9BILA